MPQPVYMRNGPRILSMLRFVLDLLQAWLRSISLLFVNSGFLHLSLGQTRMAFLRDFFPLLFGRLSFGRECVIIALNGSPFMRWPLGSIDAKLFGFILTLAGRVVVVGERQRKRIIQLGVPSARVVVITNTCVLTDVRPLGFREISSQETVRLLHLSSLIDTKGFADFLEAMAELATKPGRRFEGVLCGKVVVSEFAEHFHDEGSATTWIESKIAEINRSARVQVRWIRGASGLDKTRLYEEADIFVLPTRYPVEAQPLVLLEAMAVGCAIITTRIGEIETILDESCAHFLESGDIDVLVMALEELGGNPGRRRDLGENAAQRFHAQFSLDKHLDAWESLLTRTTAR